MNSKILHILLFFSIISLSACGKKTDVSIHTVDKSAVILAFGDSLTYGYGAKKDESYPAKLESIIGYKVVNAGLNGDTAEGAITRLVEEIEDNKPELVILGLGGNDMLRSKGNLESNLIKLIEYIKSQNIQVVLLATPEPNVTRNLIGVLKDAPVYSEVSKKTQTYVIEDIYAKYLSKEKYKSDLIHLNAEGYNLVAEQIASELKDKKFIN